MSNYYGRDYPPQAETQYYGAPQQSYGGYDNNYSTYQPPRDDSYRQDMSVTRYDDEEARYRGGSRSDYREDDRRHHRSSSRGRDYDDRRSDYEDRRYSRERSRGSRRGSRGLSESRERDFGFESERGGPHKDHHKGKEVGAGVLGAAIGGFAGHELGHNKMATTIGVLAGAWGGYELEKHHEKKKERRESQQVAGYSDNYSRRSLSGGSRSRSRSQGRRRSEYEDDEYQRRYERYN